MYIAWQHNSQCDVHCGDIIHWDYWFTLGGLWFAATFVSTFSAFAACVFLWRNFRSGSGT